MKPMGPDVPITALERSNALTSKTCPHAATHFTMTVKLAFSSDMLSCIFPPSIKIDSGVFGSCVVPMIVRASVAMVAPSMGLSTFTLDDDGQTPLQTTVTFASPLILVLNSSVTLSVYVPGLRTVNHLENILIPWSAASKK